MGREVALGGQLGVGIQHVVPWLGPETDPSGVVVAVAGEIAAGGNGCEFNGVLRHSEAIENGLGEGYDGRTVGALVARESVPSGEYLGSTLVHAVKVAGLHVVGNHARG